MFRHLLRSFGKLSSRLLALSGLCLLLPVASSAQDKPIQWGEVPREDLEMTRFPADSNATAVILSDVGDVSFGFPGLQVSLRRHLRIKILSEAGYGWGTVSIPYQARGGAQKVTDIKGQTISLAPDGSVRRIPMDRKAIFDEDVDGATRRIRFALPALAPGCVAEYRYEVQSRHPGAMTGWQFQNGEPTRWSEFRAKIPNMLDYAMLTDGIEKFSLEESETLPLQAASGSLYNFKVVSHRWALRDVPALRKEPFMTTPDDFLARIRFQLSAIAWPGQNPVEILTTWEKLGRELMSSEGFGLQLGRHKTLRHQAEGLTAGLGDPEARMRAIHDYVRGAMSWNGRYGIQVQESLEKAWTARRGASPEIALILVDMLRSAGLDAHPVLLSTRDHGKVTDQYPLLSQFNHVVAFARIGDRTFLLDATDALCPSFLLPVAALNGTGWLVDAETPRWINIRSPGALIQRNSVFAELSAEGTVSGWFQESDEGYAGLIGRHRLQGKKDQEFVTEGWLSNLPGARLDSFQIGNRDSVHLPLLVRGHFALAEYAQAAGNQLYLNPILFLRVGENPFKLPDRQFPVDFAYGRQHTYTLHLALPEGYRVQEIPGRVALALPEGGGQFIQEMEGEGNMLKVTSHLVIGKPLYRPKEYRLLREFYNKVVAAHAGTVVLRRLPPADPDGGGRR